MIAICPRYDDYLPMVFRSSGEHGAVLLYGHNAADVSRLQSLLAASGYHYKSSSDALDEAMDSGFYAVIICHREAGSDAQIPLENWGNGRVIVVSDDVTEKFIVSTLNSGAHYFFDSRDPDRILSARVQSALRQHGKAARQPLTLGDIRFDIQKRSVSRAGETIDLSPKEFDFALYLFSNRDRIVGNHELMTSVWSLPTDMDTRRIDTAACRVRKKLNLFSGEGWELKRIRRVGYRLDQLDQRPADEVRQKDRSQALLSIDSVSGQMLENMPV